MERMESRPPPPPIHTSMAWKTGDSNPDPLRFLPLPQIDIKGGILEDGLSFQYYLLYFDSFFLSFFLSFFHSFPFLFFPFQAS